MCELSMHIATFASPAASGFSKRRRKLLKNLKASRRSHNHEKLFTALYTLFNLVKIMMLYITILSAVLALACGSSSTNKPVLGRAAVWTPNTKSNKNSRNYITRTTYVTQVSSDMNNEMQSSEISVLFKPKDNEKSCFLSNFIQNSMKMSDSMKFYTNIYQDEDSTQSKQITLDTKSTPIVLTMQGLVDLVKNSMTISENSILNDGQANVYEVEMSNHLSDQDLFNDVSNLLSGFNAKYLIIEQPSDDAIAPTLEEHRVLEDQSFATTTNASSTTNIYYKPEGSEYSIYYADTYLYITPDIFTGLLTSLFIAGVLLVGLSCLNSIQGTSSFVLKPIPLGKEY